MTEMNGAPQHPVDLDEAAEMVRRDMQRLAATREPSIQVQEPTPVSGTPFDQKAHDLMIRGIDQVTTEWVGELEHARENSKKVEQLVMERAAKVRADITALYLLGSWRGLRSAFWFAWLEVRANLASYRDLMQRKDY